VGKLGIIGGSPGLTGAVTLAQSAALRSGVGLVTCAVPNSLHTIVSTQTLEGMSLPLPDEDGFLTDRSIATLSSFLDSVDAVVVGPGLGRQKSSGLVVETILARNLPTAIDADALWHLGRSSRTQIPDLGLRVVTPHEGELRRLFDACGLAWNGRTREGVEAIARKLNATVIAKGPGTIIAAPSEETVVNPSGNPGLASGGSGDVLAGVLGAFLARGDRAFDAATRATWLHGRAADFAAYGDAAIPTAGRPSDYPATAEIGEESLIASDVIANLSRAIRELQSP